MAGPSIRWLVSYPKSGNTWLRFLLINLIHGPQADTSRFEQLIPDVHEGLDPARLIGPGPHYVKSHLMFGESMPLRAQTERFVYIVRHPLDVLASNLDYLFLANYEKLGRLPEDERRRAATQYIDGYLERGGDPRWIAFGMGSWVQHVESWTGKAGGVPGIVVRYEDLSRDAEAEVAKVCEFLGLEASHAEVAKAVEASRFEKMRSIEEAEIRQGRGGFFHKGNFRTAHDEGLRFMNRGEVGRGARMLAASQIERAVERFGGLMERFGYGVPTGTEASLSTP